MWYKIESFAVGQVLYQATLSMKLILDKLVLYVDICLVQIDVKTCKLVI